MTVKSSDIARCTKCNRIGYYKTGLCIQCRKSKCAKCGAITTNQGLKGVLCGHCRAKDRYKRGKIESTESNLLL